MVAVHERPSAEDKHLSGAHTLIGAGADLHLLEIRPSGRLIQALRKIDERLGDIFVGEGARLDPSLKDLSPAGAIGRESLDDGVCERIHRELCARVFIREAPEPKASMLTVD